MKYIFSWAIYIRSDVKLKLCWIFRNFKMTFNWGPGNFFVGSVTRSTICNLNSQEHSWNFKLLVGALAQILMELWHFQNITFFNPVTWFRDLFFISGTCSTADDMSQHLWVMLKRQTHTNIQIVKWTTLKTLTSNKQKQCLMWTICAFTDRLDCLS